MVMFGVTVMGLQVKRRETVIDFILFWFYFTVFHIKGMLGGSSLAVFFLYVGSPELLECYPLLKIIAHVLYLSQNFRFQYVS